MLGIGIGIDMDMDMDVYHQSSVRTWLSVGGSRWRVVAANQVRCLTRRQGRDFPNWLAAMRKARACSLALRRRLGEKRREKRGVIVCCPLSTVYVHVHVCLHRTALTLLPPCHCTCYSTVPSAATKTLHHVLP
jgi:hypothetical protein